MVQATRASDFKVNTLLKTMVSKKFTNILRSDTKMLRKFLRNSDGLTSADITQHT